MKLGLDLGMPGRREQAAREGEASGRGGLEPETGGGLEMNEERLGRGTAVDESRGKGAAEGAEPLRSPFPTWSHNLEGASGRGGERGGGREREGRVMVGGGGCTRRGKGNGDGGGGTTRDAII